MRKYKILYDSPSGVWYTTKNACTKGAAKKAFLKSKKGKNVKIIDVYLD